MLAFIVGIPAYFIAILSVAIGLFMLIPLPPMIQYPLGAVVLVFAVWGAVISSKWIFQRLGL